MNISPDSPNPQNVTPYESKQQALDSLKQVGGRVYYEIDVEFLKKRPENLSLRAKLPLQTVSALTFSLAWMVHRASYLAQNAVPIFTSEKALSAALYSAHEITQEVIQESTRRLDWALYAVDQSADKARAAADITTSILSMVPILGSVVGAANVAVKATTYAAKAGTFATRVIDKTSTTTVLYQTEIATGVLGSITGVFSGAIGLMNKLVFGSASYVASALENYSWELLQNPNEIKSTYRSAKKVIRGAQGWFSSFTERMQAPPTKKRMHSKGEQITKESIFKLPHNERNQFLFRMLWIAQHSPRHPVSPKRVVQERMDLEDALQVYDSANAGSVNLGSNKILLKNILGVTASNNTIQLNRKNDTSLLSRIIEQYNELPKESQSMLTPYDYAEISSDNKMALLRYVLDRGIPQKKGIEQGKILTQLARFLDAGIAYPEMNSESSKSIREEYDLDAVENHAIYAFNQLPQNLQDEFVILNHREFTAMSPQDLNSILDFTQMSLQESNQVKNPDQRISSAETSSILKKLSILKNRVQNRTFSENDAKTLEETLKTIFPLSIHFGLRKLLNQKTPPLMVVELPAEVDAEIQRNLDTIIKKKPNISPIEFKEIKLNLLIEALNKHPELEIDKARLIKTKEEAQKGYSAKNPLHNIQPKVREGLISPSSSIDLLELEEKLSPELISKGALHAGAKKLGQAGNILASGAGAIASRIASAGDTEAAQWFAEKSLNTSAWVLENIGLIRFVGSFVTPVGEMLVGSLPDSIKMGLKTEWATDLSLKITDYTLKLTSKFNEYSLTLFSSVRGTEAWVWDNCFGPVLNNAASLQNAQKLLSNFNGSVEQAFNAYATELTTKFGTLWAKNARLNFDDFKKKLDAIKGSAIQPLDLPEHAKFVQKQLSEYFTTKASSIPSGEMIEIFSSWGIDSSKVLEARSTLSNFKSTWTETIANSFGSGVGIAEKLHEGAQFNIKAGEKVIEAYKEAGDLAIHYAQCKNIALIQGPQAVKNYLDSLNEKYKASKPGWLGTLGTYTFSTASTAMDYVFGDFAVKLIGRGTARYLRAISGDISSNVRPAFQVLSNALLRMGTNIGQSTENVFEFAGAAAESLHTSIQTTLAGTNSEKIAAIIDPKRIEAFKKLSSLEKKHLIEQAIISRTLTEPQIKDLNNFLQQSKEKNVISIEPIESIGAKTLAAFDILGAKRRKLMLTPTLLEGNPELKERACKLLKEKKINTAELSDRGICQEYWKLEDGEKLAVAQMTIREFYLLSDREREEILFIVANTKGFHLNGKNWIASYQTLVRNPSKADLEFVLERYKQIDLEDRRIVKPAFISKFGLQKAHQMLEILEKEKYISTLPPEEKNLLNYLRTSEENVSEKERPLLRQNQQIASSYVCYLFNQADLGQDDQRSIINATTAWTQSLPRQDVHFLLKSLIQGSKAYDPKGIKDLKILEEKILRDAFPLTGPDCQMLTGIFNSIDIQEKIRIYNDLFSMRNMSHVLLGQGRHYAQRAQECHFKAKAFTIAHQPSKAENFNKKAQEYQMLSEEIKRAHDEVFLGITSHEDLKEDSSLQASITETLLTSIKGLINQLPEQKKLEVLRKKQNENLNRLSSEKNESLRSYLIEENKVLISIENELLRVQVEEPSKIEAMVEKPIVGNAPTFSPYEKFKLSIQQFFKGLFQGTREHFENWKYRLEDLLKEVNSSITEVDSKMQIQFLDNAQQAVINWTGADDSRKTERFHFQNSLFGTTYLVSDISGASFASPYLLMEYLTGRRTEPSQQNKPLSSSQLLNASFAHLKASLKMGESIAQQAIIRKIGTNIILEQKPTTLIGKLVWKINRSIRPGEYSLSRNRESLQNLIKEHSGDFDLSTLQELNRLSSRLPLDLSIRLQKLENEKHKAPFKEIISLLREPKKSSQGLSEDQKESIITELEKISPTLVKIRTYYSTPLSTNGRNKVDKLKSEVNQYLNDLLTSISTQQYSDLNKIPESLSNKDWKAFEVELSQEIAGKQIDAQQLKQVEAVLNNLTQLVLKSNNIQTTVEYTLTMLYLPKDNKLNSYKSRQIQRLLKALKPEHNENIPLEKAISTITNAVEDINKLTQDQKKALEQFESAFSPLSHKQRTLIKKLKSIQERIKQGIALSPQDIQLITYGEEFINQVPEFRQTLIEAQIQIRKWEMALIEAEKKAAILPLAREDVLDRIHSSIDSVQDAKESLKEFYQHLETNLIPFPVQSNSDHTKTPLSLRFTNLWTAKSTDIETQLVEIEEATKLAQGGVHIGPSVAQVEQLKKLYESLELQDQVSFDALTKSTSPIEKMKVLKAAASAWQRSQIGSDLPGEGDPFIDILDTDLKRFPLNHNQADLCRSAILQAGNSSTLIQQLIQEDVNKFENVDPLDLEDLASIDMILKEGTLFLSKSFSELLEVKKLMKAPPEEPLDYLNQASFLCSSLYQGAYGLIDAAHLDKEEKASILLSLRLATSLSFPSGKVYTSASCPSQEEISLKVRIFSDFLSAGLSRIPNWEQQKLSIATFDKSNFEHTKSYQELISELKNRFTADKIKLPQGETQLYTTVSRLMSALGNKDVPVIKDIGAALFVQLSKILKEDQTKSQEELLKDLNLWSTKADILTSSKTIEKFKDYCDATQSLEEQKASLIRSAALVDSYDTHTKLQEVSKLQKMIQEKIQAKLSGYLRNDVSHEALPIIDISEKEHTLPKFTPSDDLLAAWKARYEAKHAKKPLIGEIQANAKKELSSALKNNMLNANDAATIRSMLDTQNFATTLFIEECLYPLTQPLETRPDKIVEQKRECTSRLIALNLVIQTQEWLKNKKRSLTDVEKNKLNKILSMIGLTYIDPAGVVVDEKHPNAYPIITYDTLRWIVPDIFDLLGATQKLDPFITSFDPKTGIEKIGLIDLLGELERIPNI